MHCLILYQNLTSALSIVKKISTKGNLPILENILIEAKKGRINFTSTNLETGITISIGGKVVKEGSITVSASLFSEFINTITTDKIELKLIKQALLVKTEKSQASFTTIPASEFPAFPQKEFEAFNLPKNDLCLISSQVSFAASSDEGRPVLTGIKFKPQGDGLLVAATDGFRLSIRKFNLPFNEQDESIIPARTILELARIINERKDQVSNNIQVSYTKGKNQLIFTLNDIKVFSRLIEGEFPNFEKIIPTSSKTQVTIDKDEFKRAIKAASIFARESANIVRITIKKPQSTNGQGKLVISANTPQIGEEKTEVEAYVNGEENEIAFNFRFLIDFLNSIPEEEIYFQMNNPLTPGLFRSAKDNTYTHIIMPVRVQSS